MKKLILTTSLITLSAFLITLSAFCSAQASDIRTDAKVTTEGLGVKIENAIDNTTKAAKEKYQNLKVSVLNSDKREERFVDQSLNSEYTAKKLIGKTVVNGKDEKIGTLSDIIVDGKGNAERVIVSDGDFFGGGKKAAFDFNAIISQKTDGDILAKISEDSIKNAREFSYDADDAKDGKIVLSKGSYSVKELLDADVEASDKNLDIDLEDITFGGNRAEYFLFDAEHDKSDLESLAGIKFSNVKLVTKTNNEIDLKLSAAQEKSLSKHITSTRQ